MKKSLMALLVGALLLCGCGADNENSGGTKAETGQQGTAAETETETGGSEFVGSEAENAESVGLGTENAESVGLGTENAESVGLEAETEQTGLAETDTSELTETETALFAELPDTFYFSSGAGGWWTELHLEDDGTFYGLYHDSDMGGTGDDYPNGTVYGCDFSGKFAVPKKSSDFIYVTSVEMLVLDQAETEYIEDGIKYVPTAPYGLAEIGEFFVYLPGTPREAMEEGFLSWTYEEHFTEGKLNCYGIYNVEEECGFVGIVAEE